MPQRPFYPALTHFSRFTLRAIRHSAANVELVPSRIFTADAPALHARVVIVLPSSSRYSSTDSCQACSPVSIEFREPCPAILRRDLDVLILFNKPFNVLSQFTDAEKRQTLKHFISQPHVYAAGRLDRDSEGLLVLTDDGALAQRISHPRHKLPKTYWVQVEGNIDEQALAMLRQGVLLNDGMTLPAKAAAMEPPGIWPRDPPVRVRKSVPDSWLSLTIAEGRNRQVRRMTAAIGFPTLRLIRHSIGEWNLDGLQPGECRTIGKALPHKRKSR